MLAGRWLFALYCALMLWLLFGQRIGTGDYGLDKENGWNLTLFATIDRYIHVLRNMEDSGLRREAVVNLGGNVIMFLPLGFFVSFLWERLRRFSLFLPAVLAVILGIELTQLLTALGCFDVDDIFLNVIGAYMGYLFFRILWQRRQKAA